MAVAAADRSARLAQLLARTALSDQAAFAELYRLSSPHLYAVALRILRERTLAEDILQEAFVSVWNHAGGFSAAQAQPRTWPTSIVRNRCLDELRKRKPDTVTMTRDDDEPELDFADSGPTPVEMLLAGADVHQVREFIDGLALQDIPALAVSLEPSGGSTTGAPTGPVLHTGKVERIY